MKTLLTTYLAGLVLAGLASLAWAQTDTETPPPDTATPATEPAPDNGGCIDRGYGEGSYCPPDEQTPGQPGLDATDDTDDCDDCSACIDRGYGEASSCTPGSQPAVTNAGSATDSGACIDRGYGESSYCPPK